MASRTFRVKSLAPQELPRTRNLGQQFAAEVKLFSGYVPEHFESVWGPLMEADLARLFYGEDVAGEVVGFLGATFIPDLYSGVKGAQMQFVYVHPGFRHGSLFARLVKEFKKEGEARGTRKYFAGHKVAGPHSESMNHFFIREGFVPGEVIYWRNV